MKNVKLSLLEIYFNIFITSHIFLLFSPSRRLWGDPVVQRTLITTHKKYPVIAKIAQNMREHGYNRTAEEINTRIKNLKCFYNRVKKDLEIGVISTPSWPHYEAMDEILSRPIFGNNARMNLNNPQTSSQSSQSPKESVAHLVESEIKEEQISDDDLQNSSSNGDLLTPKEEPDEGQHDELLDSEIDEDFEEEFINGPPLPKLQKISSPKYTALPQLDKISTHAVEIKLLETPPSTGNTVISSTPTTTNNVTNGKISLVPTNVLLKPQAQLKNVPTPNTITAQTVQNTPSTQSMKVLLVNTLPNGGINTTTAVIGPNNSSQTNSVITTPNLPKLQPKPLPALHLQSSVTPQLRPESPKISIVPTKQEPTKHSTLRQLMNNMIRLQNENLTMQRQRLNIERQRLEYEKNMGNRIVDLLSVLAQQQQQLMGQMTPNRGNSSAGSGIANRLRRDKRSNNHQSSGDDEIN